MTGYTDGNIKRSIKHYDKDHTTGVVIDTPDDERSLEGWYH